MVEKVQTDPFIPMKWMKEHSGMQGTEYLSTDPRSIGESDGFLGWRSEHDAAIAAWLYARDEAVKHAFILNNMNVSKQICNRLLEPFLWHTALITGTEFENFFALRAHPAAEIHFADLAQKMLDAYNASEPKQLKAGQWHLPFGDQIDGNRLWETFKDHQVIGSQGFGTEYALRIATARCARISYGTFEGKDDYEADIKLHDRLLASGHLSPFEHCCKVPTEWEYDRAIRSTFYGDNNPKEVYGWFGNMHGFIPYRKLFPNENLKDPRVKHYDNK